MRGKNTGSGSPKTQVVQDGEARSLGGGGPTLDTRVFDHSASTPPATPSRIYNSQTEVYDPDAALKAAGGADGRTRIVTDAAVTGSAAQVDDPVVGWLVVVSGPGFGNALNLGSGHNTIGRGQDSRVVLDFGDESISRVAHATVVYDPRSRTFFFQHAEGVNMSYLNDQAVLTPQVLRSGDEIGLGDRTRLRFVALCGPDFDWASRSAQEAQSAR